ncbi:spatacsin isoform X2 [Prorops nasuta]|uniref:spatacsin isoform X2 n=1 Tax=Prorops nasuta TaxID=863751 RepID=UPI0034CD6694
MAEKKTIGGVPVECLTGEAAAIWSGWRLLSDRELVRESSIKGTHIELAYKCLSCRKNCTIEKATEYFNHEVDIWIFELLRKRQIFRVSHVLNNMKKDPAEYILNISIKCTDSAMRDYLCTYLKGISYLPAEHVEAWEIIKCIVEYEDKLLSQDILSSDICIKDILNLPNNIKESLCTELYFLTTNNAILQNVTSNSLWDYLLCNNRIDTLKYWIDIQHNQVPKIELSNENLHKLFGTFHVTKDMIDYIDLSDSSCITKELLKNYLCRYGIFTEVESQNTKLSLARIFGNAMTLNDFKTVLSSFPSNINANEFEENVEKEIILSYYRYKANPNHVNPEIELQIINLNKLLKDMCQHQDPTPELLINGIVESIHFTKSINENLKVNESVLLSLIFLEYFKLNQERQGVNCNILLEEIFHNENGLKVGKYSISYENLQKLLQKFPILYQIIEDQVNKNDITVYDLINGFQGLDVKKAFKWHFKGHMLPHFANTSLIKKYGYKDTLSYMYYLKEARPNMALVNLKQTQGKLYNTIPPATKSQAAYNAHIFALNHLDNLEILCSCISFIEMLGLDSDVLRIHITLAEYLQQNQDLPVNNLFKTTIQNNKKNLKTIITYLEKSIEKLFESEDILTDLNKFIDMLKIWEVIVKFAHAHNEPLIPDQILKSLAQSNCWLEFIIAAQMFAYPLKQVLKNITLFSDANIRFHLSTCYTKLLVSHVPSVEKSKGRDVKQPPYYRIDMKQTESTLTSGCSDIKEVQSSTSKSLSSNYSYTQGDDFWLTVLKCHQSQDPPSCLVNVSRLTLSPIYIVLATCYEPSSIASFCYSWMVISVARKDFLMQYADCLEQQIWSAANVSDLLQKMVCKGYIKTLYRAYMIFMPDNPFNIFFECFMECINYGDFDNSYKLLLEFKAQCSIRKCNKIFNWDCADTIYLENSYWFLTVAIRCIVTALGYNFQSSLLQSKFLKMLIKSNIGVDNLIQVPDFEKLYKILKILKKTKVKLDFKNYELSNKGYSFYIEIERCIKELVKEDDYSSALELSVVSAIGTTEVIIAQYRNEFKDQLRKYNEIKSTFWIKCASDFNQYGVHPEKTVEFFVEHAEKVSSHVERYEVLRLALETLMNIETNQNLIGTLEVAMWKSCILAGPENIELHYENHNFEKLKTELLSSISNLQIHCSLTSATEEISTEILINKLLNVGRIDIALRISSIFNYKHKDLQIIMLCLSLAEGEITPTEMTMQQKSLIMDINKGKQLKYGNLRNRLRRISSSSSLNTSISSPGSFSETDNTNDAKPYQMQIETIDLLEKLMSNVICGDSICSKVVLCYKLSVQLGKNYYTLLTLRDPTQFLQEIVESKIDNKIEIAKDIITVYDIKSNKIAEFLGKNITTSIVGALENGNDDAIFIWGYPLNAKFHLIMELCTDPSVLGLQLLEIIHKEFSRSQHERNVLALKAVVELLIRSHDCFTATCNMEGIASILRKCQQLSNVLQNLKLWKLLVRLVTGVGRFTEMNYVFHILKENDQFEFLLVKGLDKTTGLKTALLDFLKRNCPENKELFTLVALHFSLYYEIALMWENKAKEGKRK